MFRLLYLFLFITVGAFANAPLPSYKLEVGISHISAFSPFELPSKHPNYLIYESHIINADSPTSLALWPSKRTGIQVKIIEVDRQPHARIKTRIKHLQRHQDLVLANHAFTQLYPLDENHVVFVRLCPL